MEQKEKSQIADIDRSRYDFRYEEDESEYLASGITPEIINEISDEKNDPDWMREFRLKSLGIYAKTPMVEWGPSIEGLDVDNIVTYIRQKNRMNTDWDAVPDDIKETFEKLGIPKAVASSNGPGAIRAYLTGAGIAGRFDQVISGNDCARSKPEPDIFLLAAERLGVPPEACLVVEDSPSGVRAGRAAGMTVCMIPDLAPFTEELRPCCDWVLPSLKELADALERGGMPEKPEAQNG